MMSLHAVFVAVLFLSSACTSFPAWRDQALRDATEGQGRVGGSVPSGPSRTVECYDAAGKHLGYSVTSGGTVNVYGPDGGRLGYGRR